MVGRPVRMVCEQCGSDLVTREAWAEWDTNKQEWALGAIHEEAFCHACGQPTRIRELPFQPRR